MISLNKVMIVGLDGLNEEELGELESMFEMFEGEGLEEKIMGCMISVRKLNERAFGSGRTGGGKKKLSEMVEWKLDKGLENENVRSEEVYRVWVEYEGVGGYLVAEKRNDIYRYLYNGKGVKMNVGCNSCVIKDKDLYGKVVRGKLDKYGNEVVWFEVG